MKRSFVVTLSAAGASGLVGLGCAGSALGGLQDGDDDGRPRAPMAGSSGQPMTESPPFVTPTPNPPFVTPTPQPKPPQPTIAGQGGFPGTAAGAGGAYDPPSPCAQVPVNGAWCSFEVMCEFPSMTPCVAGKRAVCAGNQWYVTNWYQGSCNPPPPPPPGEDAGTAFD